MITLVRFCLIVEPILYPTSDISVLKVREVGEDKKLIIKWVNTVFVNADKGSDVTTLHDVNSHK